MTLIRWRDSFNLGIPDVDFEHRELVDLINALHERLQQEEHRDEVEDFLGEIFARISAHFALEERTMVARNFPEYWPHKADHERLLDQLRDIMEGYETAHALDADDLSSRLDSWFSVHFRTFDARFHRFVH
jgi:hemerythrin-like metal-binding protein